MADFLRQFTGFAGERARDAGPAEFALLLGASVVAALIVAFLYLRFYASRETGSEVYLSFPLLGLSVTAIFLTIQFSLPLSLGLLGALSIVRFRTSIKAPEEIGFIMLLIATALACATFNFVLLGLILAVAVVALLARQWAPGALGGGLSEGSLVLTLPEAAYRERGAALLDLARQELRQARVESLTQRGGETVVSLRFRDRQEKALALESRLRAMAPLSGFVAVFPRPGAW